MPKLTLDVFNYEDDQKTVIDKLNELTRQLEYGINREQYDTLSSYNGRSSRISDAIILPTIAGDGSAVDHTVNTDGSVNISFEWLWAGDNTDIDGWNLFVYHSTSSASYTFGDTPSEETVYGLPPDKRAFVLSEMPADQYFTLGVQAYRKVDPDINASGYVKTAIIKPAAVGENPYLPSASVAFAGDVSGTINGVAASYVTESQKGSAYGTDNNTNALFHYDQHLKSTKGTTPEGTSVATLRPDEGRFGGAVAVEETTINKLLQSQDFDDVAWTKTGTLVITSDSTKAPDGTITADTIEDDDNAGYEYITQTATCTNSETWTVSLCIKKDIDISRFPELQLSFSGGTTIYYLAQINTMTGETTIRAGFETPTLEVKDVGDYWRLCITGTNNATGNTTVRIAFFPAVTSVWGSAEATATGSCVIWGAQLENKSFATSYVPTTTTEVTRANGSLQYSKSVLNPTEGTIYGYFKMNKIPSIGGENPVFLSTGIIAGQRLIIAGYSSTNKLHIWDNDTGTEIQLDSQTSIVQGQIHSFAYTWGSAGRKLYFDGTEEATHASMSPIAFSYVDDNIQIGTHDDISFLNGLIDELRIDSVQRTADEIKAWYDSGVPFVDEAQTQIADTTEITNEGVKVSHNDGSYTMLSADGLQRHTTTGDKDYHYLYTTARVSTVGTDTRNSAPYVVDEAEVLTIVPPITVTLPSDYQNKDFEIFVEARLNQTSVNIIHKHYINPAVHDATIWLKKNWVVEAYDIDYTAGTFKIKAYAWTKVTVIGDYEYVDGLDLVYTVIA